MSDIATIYNDQQHYFMGWIFYDIYYLELKKSINTCIVMYMGVYPPKTCFTTAQQLQDHVHRHFTLYSYKQLVSDWIN